MFDLFVLFIHCELCDSYLHGILSILVYTCTFEPWHENSNNVKCATNKGSDQPAHTRRLIRAFYSPLNILLLLSCWLKSIQVSTLKRGCWLGWVYTCQNTKLLEITCHGSFVPLKTVLTHRKRPINMFVNFKWVFIKHKARYTQKLAYVYQARSCGIL